MYEISDSVRRMEIISADFAARALTGLLKAESVEDAKNRNYNDWEEAATLKVSILSAVRNSTLKPHSVIVSRGSVKAIISPDSLLNHDLVLDAEVYSKDLWSWMSKDTSNKVELTPIEELNSYKAEFVSVRDFIELIKNKYPDMSVEAIAEWMIKKFCYDTHMQVYEQEIAGKLTIPDREWYDDDNPFLRHLLTSLIEFGEDALYPQDEPSPHNSGEFKFNDDLPF